MGMMSGDEGQVIHLKRALEFSPEGKEQKEPLRV
jgi:hypothetical protein